MKLGFNAILWYDVHKFLNDNIFEQNQMERMNYGPDWTGLQIYKRASSLYPKGSGAAA